MTAPNLQRSIARLPDFNGRQAFMLSVEYTPPAAEIIKSTDREMLAIVVRQLSGADYECIVDGAGMDGRVFANTPPRTVVQMIMIEKYGAVFAEVALKPWFHQALDAYPPGSLLTIEEHTHRQLKKHASAKEPNDPDAALSPTPRRVSCVNHSRELIDVPPNDGNLRFLLLFKYADPDAATVVIRNLRLTVRVESDGLATMSLNDSSIAESQFVRSMSPKSQVRECLVKRHGDVAADKILEGWPSRSVPGRPDRSKNTLQQHKFHHLMHSAMARHEHQVGMPPDELKSMVDRFLQDMNVHNAGIEVTSMLRAPAPLAFAFRSARPETSHLADAVALSMLGTPKLSGPEKAGIRALKAFNKWLHDDDNETPPDLSALPGLSHLAGAVSAGAAADRQAQVDKDRHVEVSGHMEKKYGEAQPVAAPKPERTRYRLVEKKPHKYTNQDIYLDGQLIGVVTTLSEGFVWYHKAAQNTGIEKKLSEAVQVLCEITDGMDVKQ